MNPTEKNNTAIRLLLFCATNSCRGQLAEAFVRARSDEKSVRVYSAGAGVQPVHPLAVQVMAEAGFDISQARSKTLDSLSLREFDVAISLCDEATEQCPILPGNPARVDWDIPDPAAQAAPGDPLEPFRQTRDDIKRLVDELFDRGYIRALAQAKRQADLILSNISEGLLAHDLQRRIFYFNHAAEKITGYSRDRVIGRDCREVFPSGFCGGKCNFCDESLPDLGDVTKRTLEIAARDGELRRVEMTIKALRNAGGELAGVLVSFRDQTREFELARRLNEIQQFSGIIGRDPKMQEVFDLIRDVADSNVSILILGESGAGKELVAAAVHREGPRANKLFVPVNCGALPESLLESELFGHVRGAFTGAIRDKKGRFELADGGTIFLDEIGDISPAMQVKLLRVLQDGAFERVGGERTLNVDVRVISATNKDLKREIAEGRFREDLFYRLCVMPIQLPPLRERRLDIPLLAEHILKRSLQENHRQNVCLSAAALDAMLSYDWPGNVRELQNWLQFALIKCKGQTILPEHLPPHRPTTSLVILPSAAPTKQRRKRKLTREIVEQALANSNGNKLAAAQELGVARATLYRFLDDPPA